MGESKPTQGCMRSSYTENDGALASQAMTDGDADGLFHRVTKLATTTGGTTQGHRWWQRVFFC